MSLRICCGQKGQGIKIYLGDRLLNAAGADIRIRADELVTATIYVYPEEIDAIASVCTLSNLVTGEEWRLTDAPAQSQPELPSFSSQSIASEHDKPPSHRKYRGGPAQ
jgi:hypothetical protein